MAHSAKASGQCIAIVNGEIYTSRVVIRRGVVVIRDGRIDTIEQGSGTSRRPKGALVVDARGMIVAPGFIDLHIHGAGGGDTSDCSVESLRKMSSALVRFGTTSYLPTVYPAGKSEMVRRVSTIRRAMEMAPQGAEILGVNLEGPFLNPREKGALREKSLRLPSMEELCGLIDASNDNIRLMSIAPELPGAVELIRECRRRTIRVAVGHSDASHEEMVIAINAGINHVTHVFNALRGTRQREPGVMGTVLTNHEITVELIADMHHVHPVVINLLLLAKPADKICLITDALRIAGLRGKRFTADGRTVTVEDGVAKLSDGTIAGSVLTLNRAVRNMVATERVPLENALKMAGMIPAKVLGIDHRKGNILPGSDADIVVMDRNFDVQMTMVRGEIVHRKRKAKSG
ncbi:MAG: N-acetylglucosamine-6-phosphate deacetylase [Planctomycetes bacterium]|nr:N-acetylglucosamine-6-phosphate deacetylase [Planctomycetota bacterium]